MSKLERYNYEDAYSESAKMRKKIETGEASNYDEAEKIIDRPDKNGKDVLGDKESREAELIKEIKRMILDEKVALHSPNFVVSKILEYLEKDNHTDKEEADYRKNMEKIKSYFNVTLGEWEKIPRLQAKTSV